MSKQSTQQSRRATALRLHVLALAATFIFAACAKPTPPTAEVSTTPTPRQAQATPTPRTESGAASETIPTPAPAEARGAITRVYRDAVVIETSIETPPIVGDFNGDDSQDIAVVVRPAKGKLSKLNDEYANWTVVDPQKVLLPEVRGDVKILPKKPEPVSVREDDVLLAVIHGYQKEGWRNRLASQTYLLTNAVGEEMKRASAQDVLKSIQREGKLPALRGDVIRETLSGEKGFLYWTGSKYAWSHPAKP